jgi:DNA-binding transcriptional MerR regulator
MPTEDRVAIPNRSLFRQPEVCEIAGVPKYVLSSWEAEFPDLGVAKAAGGPRVYRRADVERVLRIKHMVFVEGLTLAGARRKLTDEAAAPSSGQETLQDVAELLGSDARERILQVQRGLRELAVMLSRVPGNGGGEDFHLSAVAERPRPAKPARVAARPASADRGSARARKPAKGSGAPKKR